jgi:hypothetical protein
MWKIREKSLNIGGRGQVKVVYISWKARKQWGPGEINCIFLRFKHSEERGQRYTPIYVTIFLKQDISLIRDISKGLVSRPM